MLQVIRIHPELHTTFALSAQQDKKSDLGYCPYFGAYVWSILGSVLCFENAYDPHRAALDGTTRANLGPFMCMDMKT